MSFLPEQFVRDPHDQVIITSRNEIGSWDNLLAGRWMALLNRGNPFNYQGTPGVFIPCTIVATTANKKKRAEKRRKKRRRGKK